MFALLDLIFGTKWFSQNSFLIICFIVFLILYFIYRRLRRSFLIRRQQILQQQEEEERRRMKEEEKAAREAEEEERRRQAEERRQALEDAINQNPLAAQYRTESKLEVNYKIIDADSFIETAPRGFVAFDLETTGLNPNSDRIVEIAAVKVRKGKIFSTFHHLVNPEKPISPEASAVNHITDDMVSSAPKIYEILPDFLDFVGRNVLVAHNAKFDSSFIAQACLRYSFIHPKRYFNSMSLSEYWPNLPDRKLSSFLAAAGIENDEAHRALGDATALAELVIKTLEKINEDGSNE